MTRVIADAPCIRKITFSPQIVPGRSATVLSFSTRPADGTAALAEAQAMCIRRAVPELDAYGVDADRGPYADRHGRISELAGAIRGACLTERLERLRDYTRPFSREECERGTSRIYAHVRYNFLLTRSGRSIPALLPYAGGILADPGRKSESQPSANSGIIVASLLESLMIATAALREAGMHVYPSLAVLDGQCLNPSVSVISLRDTTTMHTIPFTPSAEPFDSIVLLSDTAMMAAARAVLAEIKAMHLCASISDSYAPVGPALRDSLLEGPLKSMANTLLDAEKHWQGAPFVEEALGFTGTQVYDAVLAANKRAAEGLLASSAGVQEYLLEKALMRSCSAEEAAAHLTTVLQSAGKSHPVDMAALWGRLHSHASLAANNITSRLSAYLETGRQEGPFSVPEQAPQPSGRPRKAARLLHMLGLQ